MKKIHELSEELRGKLAAGEIIERPAYIVKELIDNAVDANATAIRIDLEENGIGKIMVTDNGYGMSREDLEICFKRYTTSKMLSEEDLGKITSMGFRGEALASIAAVSTLTIKSREKSSEFGYEMLIKDGKTISITPKGLPVGTQIKVENIFTKLPVRKKFLRSAITEYRQIIDIILRYILAFPAIRFDVYNDGKKIYVMTPSTQEERIRQAFPITVSSYLLPYAANNEYFSVQGFTSKPQLSYKSARNIYLYVNNRYIIDSAINSAIKQTYGTLLEPTNFPHTFLFLTIPKHLIDVNVHPRKEEVHFLQKEMLLTLIKNAIQKTLSDADLKFYDRRWSGDNKEFDNWQIREGRTNTYAAKKLKKTIIKNTLETIPQNQTYFQFHNLYIAVPIKKGILFFDQHAVHERILYEQLEKSFNEEIKKGTFYKLNKPVTIPISYNEKILLEEFKELLLQVGFQYIIHEETIEFIAVPVLLKDNNLKIILRDIIDELFDKGEYISFDYISHKLLAYLACRSAVKAGDYLTQEQCQELIIKLKQTRNPYTCPHGRPTQVEVAITYFHTLFKRK